MKQSAEGGHLPHQRRTLDNSDLAKTNLQSNIVMQECDVAKMATISGVVQNYVFGLMWMACSLIISLRAQ